MFRDNYTIASDRKLVAIPRMILSCEAYIKYVALLLVMMKTDNLIRLEVVDPDPAPNPEPKPDPEPMPDPEPTPPS